MPRVLSTETRRIVLKSDAHLTENIPTFIYRNLTTREWKSVGSLQESFNPKKGFMSATDAIYGSVKIGLKGWENMIDPNTGDEIPFDLDNIELVIDPVEAMEDLFTQMMKGVKLGNSDKKKLELQPSSEPEASVKPACQESAATT